MGLIIFFRPVTVLININSYSSESFIFLYTKIWNLRFPLFGNNNNRSLLGYSRDYHAGEGQQKVNVTFYQAKSSGLPNCYLAVGPKSNGQLEYKTLPLLEPKVNVSTFCRENSSWTANVQVITMWLNAQIC